MEETVPQHQRQAARVMLRKLWAFPLALPGLLVWLLVKAFDRQGFAWREPRRNSGVFLVYGRACRKLLDCYPWFEVDALALGFVILARDEATMQRCLAHELVHVQQALRWGPLFPVLYAASSAWAALRGLDPYHANVFERAAFKAENCSSPLP